MRQNVLPFQQGVDQKEGGLTALAGARYIWSLLIVWDCGA